MEKIKSILWIVPAWPFPPENGASVARANLIKNLALAGYNIDILVIGNVTNDKFEMPHDISLGQVYKIKTNDVENPLFRKCYFILMSLFSYQIPVVMLRFSKQKIRSQVNEIIVKNYNNWDAVVYDGLHPAAHRMRLGLYSRMSNIKKIIYREHNIESEIWFRMAEKQKNPLKKLFLTYQAKLIAQFEKSVIREADGVAAISNDDLGKLKQLETNTKISVVPISFDFIKPLEFPKLTEKIQILFLGSLDWPPNKDGLIWFLTKVWKKVMKARNDIYLSIAGSGKSDWVKSYTRIPNVCFLGKVREIESLYEQSCLVIAPIFYGSGTRVKIIEACNYGRPCISTTIGAEGIGLVNQKSYYCADNVEDWVDCLTNIQLDTLQVMGEQAFQNAKQFFAHTVAVEEFIKLL